MSARDDGGPAFPICDTSQNTATGETTSHQFICSGMTLRDAFALALAPQIYQRVQDGGFARVAHLSYEAADALLKERAK